MDVDAIVMPPPKKMGVGRPGASYEAAASVMRAAGLEPLCLYPGNNIPWPNRCTECKTVVTPRYAHVRDGRSSGCKDCGERNHPKHQIRTDAVEAVRIMRAAGLEPLVDFPGVHPAWECLCRACEEVVTPRFAHVRDGRSSGCKFCAGTAITETHAVAVMRDANLEPQEPYPGNNQAYWKVQCSECDWVGETTYAQARVLKNGCRRCGGHTFDPEEMAQMMRDGGFDPLIPYPGVDKPWLCVCRTCGHTGVKQAQQVRAGSGCMRCAGRILPAEEAAERMTAAGFIPQEPYPGRNTDRWTCLCVGCKAIVRVVYKSIMRGQGAGCCNGLLDFRRPGRSMGIYLIAHPTLNAAKVGVGVATFGKMKRLGAHLGRGWEVVAAWSEIPEPGIAFDVERAVINGWRADGMPAFLTRAQMPQAGQTETVQLDLIDMDVVVAGIEGALVDSGVEVQRMAA